MAVVPFLAPQPKISPDPELLRGSIQDRVNWLKDSLERGRRWYSSQRSTVDPHEAMDLVAGIADADPPTDTQSDLRSSEIDRNISELIAELANLRAEGHVKTDDKILYDKAAILQKRYKSWFQMNRIKLVFKAAIAWAVVLGQGFLWLDYDADARGPGKGEHRLRALGPHQVVPDGLPSDGDYQKAYAVHVIEEMPLQDARRRFPHHSDIIQPDRGMPVGWLRRVATSRWLAPALQIAGVLGDKPDEVNTTVFPMVDIVTTYIRDFSVNMTGQTITKGEPGTTSSYSVPAFESEIDTGIKNDDGSPLMRPASRNDALIYPRRRKVVWCSSTCMEDDTSDFWHGKLPLTRLAPKKWPWDANGTSLLKAMGNIQRALTRLMRAVDDVALAGTDPAIMYDESLLSDSFTEKFNPRQRGVRIRSSAMNIGSDLIKMIMPADFYKVDPIVPEWMKWLEEKMKRYALIQDVQSIAKARQVPSGDTLEKMIELAGPIIRDYLESIEISCSEIGEMFVWNAMQYDSLARRLEILGDDGVTREDFDYDPGNMIPSHLEGEDETQVSRASTLERGIARANKFAFHVTPGSLHDLSRSSAKLMILQAIKGGLKIDQWTLAKYFGVEYYGPEPEGTHTVLERLMAEQRMKEEAAKRMAQAMAEGQIAGGGEAGGGGGKPGRKPTGKKTPHLEEKDQGTRTTMSTSE